LLIKVTAKRAQQWCQEKNNIPYFETSAKEAVNVEQAFQTIAKNALAREKDQEIYTDIIPDQVRITDQSKPQQSNCSC
jgi:Ras-related protein Rab-7A